MSSRTMMEMFLSSYYSKVLVPCLLSMNSHSNSHISFGFTYIEFSTIRANNWVYKTGADSGGGGGGAPGAPPPKIGKNAIFFFGVKS